jgi:hypothetical protein
VGTDVSYVRYPTFIRCFRVELSLEPVGCHDTDFPFTRSWASVPDLSLYSGTLHQPPDPVKAKIYDRIPYLVILLSAFRHFIIADWRCAFGQHSSSAFFPSTDSFLL